MGNDKIDSKYFDVVIKCYEQCCASGYYPTKPGEPMSNDEFAKEISKILSEKCHKNIKVEVTDEWKIPKF